MSETRTRAKRKKGSPGIGMPAALYLEDFGAICADFFGMHVYHVGSSLFSKQWRDVDVRAMLDDDVYEAMGFGDPDRPHHSRRWVAATMAFSALGKQMTGLPIDFQVQQTSYANAKWPGNRSALGIVGIMRRNSDVPNDLDVARKQIGTTELSEREVSDG